MLANPGVVPHLLSAHNVRVPDLAVTCSPLQLGQATLPDPVLLIEVLSASNQAQTWSNVRAYTSIPSVREILVLHSSRVGAEMLRREADGGWSGEPEAISDVLTVSSIGFHVRLADLYARSSLTA